MKSFSSFAKDKTKKEDGPCWKSHKQVGMKKKGNKMVPNCVPKEERKLDLGFSAFLGEAPIDVPDFGGDEESFAIDVLSKIDDGISTIDSAIELDNRPSKTNSKKLGLFAIMPGDKRVKWATLARQIIADTEELEEGPNPPADRIDKDITIKHKDMSKYIYVNCRPDGKASKAGDDPNELMTAALCLKSKLAIPQTVEDMDELIAFVKQEVKAKKVIGASAGQIASLDGQDYVNLCQAASAALAIHKNGYGNSDKVYLTGQAWDKDVTQFQITKYGMKDFNSSDFICKKGANFIGISLKKKKRITEADPTLINKSFSTLFQDTKFNSMMSTLDRSAAAFYIKVLRKASRNPKEFNVPPAVVDAIKGVRLSQTNWKKFVQRIPNDLINAELKSAGNRNLFQKMFAIIMKNKDLMANQLINLIFKSDLRTLKQVNFDFALVTGIGDYGPRKGVDVKPGEYKDIETTSTKLNSLLKDQGVGFRKTPGAVQAFDKGATAAMLKFDLMIGDLPVCHIELRYKGNFRSAPSFLAKMTDEFKAEFQDKIT